jgi:hypothetical protein
MNTFKKTSLHAAVLAGLGVVAAAGSASAVHVNPDGTGQVLLYPYYTTRSDAGASPATEYYDNYISVVNSTNSTKAVKVRILEGKRSAEVLDFNLFLSPQDVWTGAIIRTADGAGLVSIDRSCVVPTTLFRSATGQVVIPTTGSLNAFKNFVYAPSNDGGGTSLDRTREGYIEIIEMGDVTNPTWTSWIKHNTAGIPANCGALQGIDGAMSPGITRPSGGLFGRMSLVNVASGSDFSYDALAIDDWSDFEQYTGAGDLLPRLNGGGGALASPSDTTSDIFISGGVVTDNWGTGQNAAADAISATIMHSSVMNEFNVLKDTSSGTDWVVTFPTKKLYVNVGTGAARRPFASNYNNVNCGGASGAPDQFTYGIYNREEQVPGIAPVIILPSPLPPGPPPSVNQFCYEANALSFNPGASLFGSTNLVELNPTTVLVDAAGAPVAGPETNQTGWLSVNFNQAVQSMTAPSGNVYRGLPVIGFMAEDYLNTAARAATDPRGRVSTYGGSFSHKYRRSVGR